jgi:hypothetical protein
MLLIIRLPAGKCMSVGGVAQFRVIAYCLDEGVVHPATLLSRPSIDAGVCLL